MAKRNKPTKKSFQNLTPKPKLAAPSSWLQWLDDHILLILAGFLFAFIPLYPKLPLADIIPGYIVRLRVEDLFVAAAMLVYGIQILRKKAEWKTPFTWIILAYAVVGLLSSLSAVFITQTVPAELLHFGKTLLHYFRYLEYFSLFFIAYSAIKTRKHFIIMLSIFSVTVLLISLYGYGQRYYFWPVYSTMNREFSKGQRLVLTPNARVQSTFGGHYDMAGYLVIALPLLLATFFALKEKKWRVLLFVIYTTGLWLLIMSVSRTSFIGFIGAVGVLMVLLALQQPTWLKKLWWGVSRGFVVYFMIAVMFLTFGQSIFDRFLQVIRGYPMLSKTYDTVNESRKNIMAGEFGDFIRTSMPEPQEMPDNAIAFDNSDNVLTPSDTQPELPPDVDTRIPEPITIITIDEDGVASSSVEMRERTFSDNAHRWGLSMAIRLDTLWPRAIAGFYKNPLLGSGYATLTKETTGQFTEAESTDNNFLRTLGETGLLGFITFYGVVGVGLSIAVKTLLNKSETFPRAIAIGFISATVGMLLNAVFIDVFAASKVAFTYWALTGFVLAYLTLELKNKSRVE